MLFSEVAVPQNIKDVLINTKKSGRISHAQLFLAQEGMPALALALAYCQYISCTHPTETDSCGVCPSCQKFKNIAHPDLHCFFPNIATDKIKHSNSDAFYDKWREIIMNNNAMFSFQQWADFIDAGNKQPIINVNDVSLLLEKLLTKPYESAYHFVIIWLPEKMNEASANKLLKTLEEPDGKTLIILVSENYEALISTIVSRTQLLKINRFSLDEFADVVANRVGCDKNTAIDISYITNFNLQQAISQGVNVIDEDSYQNFVEMMRSAYRMSYFSRQPQKVEFDKSEQLINALVALGREKQIAFLTYSLNLVRKCLLLNIELGDMVKSPDEEANFLKGFYPFINLNNGHYVVEALNKAISDVRTHVDGRIIFVDLLLLLGQYIRLGDNRLQKK